MNDFDAAIESQSEVLEREQWIPVSIKVELPARIHSDPDGGLWADVPALPGCITEGDSVEEVLLNLKEAAEGWLLAKQDIEINGWPSS